mgnify:CR=1 FL=1
MDTKRQGEIALVLLKHLMRKKGLNLSPSMMRDFGNASKETGIPIDELKQFSKSIMQEMLDECFEAEEAKDQG